ncbi:MAG: hypothetical protein ACHQKZ_04920 [Solirubrobacterales bacterium]|jgi:hypothetical protein
MKHALIGALMFILAAPGIGFADKPDKDKDKKKDKHDQTHETYVINGFNTDERGRVQVFFVETHGRGKCPPGLAKKNNGCLPPGQAKKRYVVGHPLPSNIRFEPLPREVEVRIGPAPKGYQYGIVDGDLLKLAAGTLLVVDAINGLVN